MYAALSLFVIAVGAILKFAVADKVEGVALGEVGLILLVIGVLGLIISAFAEVSRRHKRTERVVEGGGRPAQREELREQL